MSDEIMNNIQEDENEDRIIEFIDEMPPEGYKTDPDYIYFGLSSKCFMKVDRELFDKISAKN